MLDIYGQPYTIRTESVTDYCSGTMSASRLRETVIAATFIPMFKVVGP